MTEITVSGDNYEEALAAGLRQLGVSAEMITIEVLDHTHDDTLPGAEPLPGTTLRLKLKQDALVDQARQHLKKILELIGVQAHIETLSRRGGTTLNILAGDDGALIIGRNGQNLEALQYLVNRMVMRGTRELWPISVDSEGYRQKRVSKLEEIARRTAQRVLKNRRDIALEPMPASERKIVHMALKEMRGVHTISRGEEGERHIVVTYGSGEGIQQDRKLRPHRGPRGGGRRDAQEPKPLDEEGDVNGNVREPEPTYPED